MSAVPLPINEGRLKGLAVLLAALRGLIKATGCHCAPSAVARALRTAGTRSHHHTGLGAAGKEAGAESAAAQGSLVRELDGLSDEVGAADCGVVDGANTLGQSMT